MLENKFEKREVKYIKKRLTLKLQWTIKKLFGSPEI